MSDPFFTRIRDDWQSHAGGDAVLRQLRRHRWTPYLMLAIELAGCFIALLAGLWFTWVAAHVGSNALLYGLSAAALLSAAPVLAVATFVARRPGLGWDEATSQTLLETGIRRANASLRALVIGRLHIGLVVVFVIVLWIAQQLQFIDARRFLVFYSLVSLFMCGAQLLWYRESARRLKNERDSCLRLLEELQAPEYR